MPSHYKDKASFLKRIKAGIKGAGETLGNYRHIRKSKKQTKRNIDKIARARVKKGIVGGESQEQLQKQFMGERKKIRKKYKY